MVVPWAEGRSDMTSRFESHAIALLSEMSIAAVARRLDFGWDTIDAIISRNAKRGLARRETRVVRFIGIDEKAQRKGISISRSSRISSVVSFYGSASDASVRRSMHTGYRVPPSNLPASKASQWTCGNRISTPQ